MKYGVWEFNEDGEPLEHHGILSRNKKSLKGKWQIFVKEKVKDNEDLTPELIGFRLSFYEGEELVKKFVVHDDRDEPVYKTKPKKDS